MENLGPIASVAKYQKHQVMSENQPYQICFILGMMPRTGTNWVHDLLKTSEFTCDVGPIWEDNILNQTAGIKQLAKTIVSSWNSKWKAGSIKLDVAKAQRKIEERIEQAIEAFIIDSIRQESVQKTPAWVLLKAPNAWEAIPPSYLLRQNKCITLVRHPVALIQSGMKSFGWSLFGACLRFNTAADAVLQLRASSNNIHFVKFEELGEDLNKQVERLFDFLDMPVPEVDHMSLGVRGKSAKGSISWGRSSLTTADKLDADQKTSTRLSLHDKFILCVCQDSAIQLGYPPMQEAPSRIFQTAARTLFRVFILLRKLKP